MTSSPKVNVVCRKFVSVIVLLTAWCWAFSVTVWHATVCVVVFTGRWHVFVERLGLFGWRWGSPVGSGSVNCAGSAERVGGV